MILGWAISIHKAQGQTLDNVIVDLKCCFGKGMVYTALSRCRSIEGLQVLNIRPDAHRVDKSVIDFYNNMVNSLDDMVT